MVDAPVELVLPRAPAVDDPPLAIDLPVEPSSLGSQHHAMRHPGTRSQQLGTIVLENKSQVDSSPTNKWIT